MADLDDTEMMKCPHCGREAPRDFFPLCSCERDLKSGKKLPKKPALPEKPKKPKQGEYADPYEYDL
jgi:endogenous inhibitor of DNA gyrase (YacG/DUF329 family)